MLRAYCSNIFTVTATQIRTGGVQGNPVMKLGLTCFHDRNSLHAPCSTLFSIAVYNIFFNNTLIRMYYVSQFCKTVAQAVRHSNQIYFVTFMCITVDTSFIFTKKSNVAKCDFDICNAEMAHIKNLDIQSQFSTSKNV